jgi:hypothetical protein
MRLLTHRAHCTTCCAVVGKGGEGCHIVIVSTVACQVLLISSNAQSVCEANLGHVLVQQHHILWWRKSAQSRCQSA